MTSVLAYRTRFPKNCIQSFLCGSRLTVHEPSHAIPPVGDLTTLKPQPVAAHHSAILLMRGISHLSISRFTGTRLDFVQHCSHSLWLRGCLVLLTVTPLCHSVTVVWLWGARKVFYWSANHSTSSELNNCAERHLSGVTISPFTNETLSFMIVCCRFFKFTWNTNHSLLIFGPFSPILQSGSIRETTQITHSTILWGYSKVHEICSSQWVRQTRLIPHTGHCVRCEHIWSRFYTGAVDPVVVTGIYQLSCDVNTTPRWTH